MKIYPLRIIIDSKGNVLEIELNNGECWALEGKCLRCGKCCHTDQEGCLSFTYEILNGVKVAKCESEWTKPWQCKIYPTNPYDPKEQFDTCGYRWRKIS